MLKSCFGLSLRTGTSIIAISNAIASVCYIIFNIWQHSLFRELLMVDENEIMPLSDRHEVDEYRHHAYTYSSNIHIGILFILSSNITILAYSLKLLNMHYDQRQKNAKHVMINSITSTFLLAAFTLLFANCELKYATLKNATHKIYLWLLVDYVQLITIIIMEIAVLIRHFYSVYSFIGLFFFFILVDAILTFQLLVINSFYAEEKLIEEFNYTQLVSKLKPSLIEDQDYEELQHVELN